MSAWPGLERFRSGPPTPLRPPTPALSRLGSPASATCLRTASPRRAIRSTNDIKGWQGAATVRTVVTDSGLSYSFRMIETNKETVELFYGVTVTQTASDGTYTIVPANTGGRKSFIFDVIDGTNLKRIYVPQGEVSEVGEVKYAGGEPIGTTSRSRLPRHHRRWQRGRRGHGAQDADESAASAALRGRPRRRITYPRRHPRNRRRHAHASKEDQPPNKGYTVQVHWG